MNNSYMIQILNHSIPLMHIYILIGIAVLIAGLNYFVTSILIKTRGFARLQAQPIFKYIIVVNLTIVDILILLVVYYLLYMNS